NIEFGLDTYRYRDYNYFPKNALMFKSFNRRMDRLYQRITAEQGKVDLIHAHSCFWAGIAANYLSKKYDLPLVLTEHSSLEHSRYIRNSYKKIIFETYNQCAELIAVGNGLKKELANYTEKPVSIIHNIVDLELFRPDSLATQEPYREFTFFTLAYLEKGKGMEMLIEAFAQTFRGQECRLIIGGDGSLKEQLAELVRKQEIEKQVKFLGALERPEVAREMHKCSAFVLASEYETFGVVYIEATACGKPIIATRNGGAEDIVTETNGILIDKQNPGMLCEALKEIKQNINHYDEAAIRRECAAKYSANVFVAKIKKVYRNLLPEEITD
ncbi:MAG TPA: glycosyltransferase, partial [Desulfitobacteriaceae bacterium]|nr:glycosyltransferase [Desulfitobacteriaceae bacterium]